MTKIKLTQDAYVTDQVQIVDNFVRTHVVFATVLGVYTQTCTLPGHEKEPEAFMTYSGMGAISGVDCRHQYHITQPPGQHWSVHFDGIQKWDKMVQVEVPEDVSYGHYTFRGYRGTHGPDLYHTKYESRDGRGPEVTLWTNENPLGYLNPTFTEEQLIDAAIASGITMSIPTADGGRKEVPVKVLEVSPLNLEGMDRTAWRVSHETVDTTIKESERKRVAKYLQEKILSSPTSQTENTRTADDEEYEV